MALAVALAAPPRAGILALSPSGNPHTDRGALQAALDSLKARGGGTLRLASGLFRIGRAQNALVCDSCRDIVLEGAGDATRVQADPSAKGADAILLFRHSSDVYIRKMRFEGLLLPDTAWGSNLDYHGGIRFMECRNVGVEHCSFRGFYTGAVILQSGTRGFLVESCRFDSVAYRQQGDYGAVSIETGSGQGKVVRNRFSGLTHSAISAYVADSLQIVGNQADFDRRSVYTMGIFAPQGLRASLISRNRFSGPFNEGVVLNAGEHPVVGNRVERNRIAARFAGVALNDGRFGCNQHAAVGNVIYGNDIEGRDGQPVEHAVLLNRSSRNTIRANRMRRFKRAVSEQNCSSENRNLGNALD